MARSVKELLASAEGILSAAKLTSNEVLVKNAEDFHQLSVRLHAIAKEIGYLRGNAQAAKKNIRKEAAEEKKNAWFFGRALKLGIHNKDFEQLIIEKKYDEARALINAAKQAKKDARIAAATEKKAKKSEKTEKQPKKAKEAKTEMLLTKDTPALDSLADFLTDEEFASACAEEGIADEAVAEAM